MIEEWNWMKMVEGVIQADPDMPKPLSNSDWDVKALQNMDKPPRQRKLEAAKAWLKEHGSHPGCLQRFMKSRGML